MGVAAAHLERVDRAQERLADLARARAADQGAPWARGDPAPRATIGSALACLEAARSIARRTGCPPGPVLDQAMAALLPAEAR